MARNRRATWMLSPPKWRISVTANCTKSSHAGRPVHQPHPARRIAHPFVVQVPAADVAKQVMNLVDGQDRGGRVVDGRRKSLGGDVHHDPQRKGRVLLQGAFLTHGDRLTQGAGRQGCPALKTRNKGSPIATKSPTCGTISMTQSARWAIDTSPSNIDRQDDAILEIGHRAASVLRRGWRTAPATLSAPWSDASDRHFR